MVLYESAIRDGNALKATYLIEHDRTEQGIVATAILRI
jgi:hypothetical protein